MSPLQPLSQSAATPAEQLVARAASVAPGAVDLARWDEVVALAALRRQSRWRLVPAFVASVALGAALVLVLRPAPPPPPRVELVASPGTSWSQVSTQAVALRSGQLRVARASPERVRIETPHAVLEASRARFLAEVIASGTSLVVEEGEVVLRAGAETRVVHAGESLVWPPAPVIPAALLEAAPGPTETQCASAGSARRSCLEAEARASTLDAQAALFELGSLESSAGRSGAAIDAWRESLRRFPDGVLHPEVRLKLLVELVRARRFEEAGTAAAEFERACATDARLEDVRALAATLPRRAD